MRKLTVILLAMFGLVLFNSCKDEVEKIDGHPVNTVSQLKSYTGKTYEEVNAIMQHQQFFLSDTEHDDELTIYFYTSAYSPDITFTLLEFENKIAFAMFSASNENRDLLLKSFTDNSQDAISFVGNTGVIYEGQIELDNSMNEGDNFENRNDFLTVFGQNRNNISYCFESWKNDNYIIGNEFAYEEGHEEEYDLFNFCLIGYADLNLMPQGFMPSNKSIFKSLFKKRK